MPESEQRIVCVTQEFQIAFLNTMSLSTMGDILAENQWARMPISIPALSISPVQSADLERFIHAPEQIYSRAY